MDQDVSRFTSSFLSWLSRRQRHLGNVGDSAVRPGRVPHLAAPRQRRGSGGADNRSRKAGQRSRV